MFPDLVIIAEKVFGASPMTAGVQENLPIYLSHFDFFEQGAIEVSYDLSILYITVV